MEEKLSLEKSGRIILPNHELYEEKRKVWNARIDRKPAVIFECKCESDVISAVQYAKKEGLEISIKGGGHHIDGAAVCDGGVMIDVSNMKDIQVDESQKTVKVQGGATLRNVDLETQKYGLATPTGTVSATGIAGLALGGGFGYLRGKHGLTCDNLVRARVVTADAKCITVDEKKHPDLFWALRGGGGNFGVVTEFEFQLHPVGPNVLALDVMYDYEDLKQILNQLQNYMETAVDDISVNLSIVQLPSAPFLPEHLHHKRVVMLSGMYAGELNIEVEQNIIEPLLNLAEPIIDQTGIMPYVDLQKKLDAMVPSGVPFAGTSLFFKEWTEKSINLLMNAIETGEFSMTMVQIWALNGAMNRVAPHETAFAVRNANYLLLVDAQVPEENPEKCAYWMNHLYDALLSYSHDETSYVNGIHLDKDITKTTYGINYDRLSEIKGKYDPQNLFCHNHNVKPKR